MYMEWSLLADGIVESKGRVDDLDIAPRQKRSYQLPFSTSQKNVEYFLNITLKTKEATTSIPKDYELAIEQFTLSSVENFTKKQ